MDGPQLHRHRARRVQDPRDRRVGAGPRRGRGVLHRAGEPEAGAAQAGGDDPRPRPDPAVRHVPAVPGSHPAPHPAAAVPARPGAAGQVPARPADLSAAPGRARAERPQAPHPPRRRGGARQDAGDRADPRRADPPRPGRPDPGGDPAAGARAVPAGAVDPVRDPADPAGLGRHPADPAGDPGGPQPVHLLQADHHLDRHAQGRRVPAPPRQHALGRGRHRRVAQPHRGDQPPQQAGAGASPSTPTPCCSPAPPRTTATPSPSPS